MSVLCMCIECRDVSRELRTETLAKWATMSEQRDLLIAEFPPQLPSSMKQQRVAAFDDAMLAAIRAHVCAICGERVHRVESLSDTYDEIRDDQHFIQLLGRLTPPAPGVRTVGMIFVLPFS